MTLEYLELWAKIKGITVIGTADITHPGWLAEIQKKLEPAEPGLYKLKKEYSLPLEPGFKNTQNPSSIKNRDVRFILTGEISNIYKQDDQTRKVHSLIFMPDFESVSKLQKKLKSQDFNITSDGRPILGQSVHDLLETTLEVSSQSFLIPTHIWTPWFSCLGSKSGFNRITDAFGDLSTHIKAVEMGLSSDPPMNWMCSHLDQYTLIANSDAHSPEKIGRNANIFNTELSYKHIIQAISDGNGRTFEGTVNLYPQEGKYHGDGHRKCDINWSPIETLKHDGICPECGKTVTIGVLNRVADLSDRESITERPQRLPFFPIIPLKEILAEILQGGTSSKKVSKAYQETIQELGAELDILLNVPIEGMNKVNDLLGEAIRRMRNREVHITPGFDGEYGIVKVFQEQEKHLLGKQNSLFETKYENTDALIHPLIDFDLKKYQELKILNTKKQEKKEPQEEKKRIPKSDLTPEQEQAAYHKNGPCMIVAGPGTGKTRTLTYRIKTLEKQGVKPEKIIALTFTNKAAREIRNRIQTMQSSLNLHSPDLMPTICTFQSLGLHILKKYPHSKNRTSYFTIIDEHDKRNILKTHLHIQDSDLKFWSQQISNAKQKRTQPQDIDNLEFKTIFEKYEFILRNLNVFDFDDLIYHAIDILENNEDILKEYQKKWQYWLIDEFQDTNPIQYELVRTLCPQKNANICIIGDPDQSIYGFRGANAEFIKTFKKDYPDVKKYKLTQSYRCPNTVLKASGSVLGKPPITGLNNGIKIHITKTKDSRSEAEHVAGKIKDLIGGVSFWSFDSGVAEGETHKYVKGFDDIAILVRSKSQIPSLEKALLDHNIPFQSISNTPFYQQKPISTILDILKYTQDDKNIFLKKKRTIYQDRLYTIKQKSTVSQTISHIVLMLFRHENKEHGEGIKKLIKLAEEFGNHHQEFIDYVELGKGYDTYQKNECVTIMTIHASKGLEFPAVFIPGCEEGLFPYTLNKKTVDIKEERRLLYVGMTRTQKLLFLSHADRRYIDDQPHELKRSRFLDKIEQNLLEVQEQNPQKREEHKDKEEEKQMNLL